LQEKPHNFERIGIKAGELVLDIFRGTATPIISLSFWTCLPYDVRLATATTLGLKRSCLPKEVHRKQGNTFGLQIHIIGALPFACADMLVLVLVQRRRKICETSLRQELRNWINSSTSPSTCWHANTDAIFYA